MWVVSPTYIATTYRANPERHNQSLAAILWSSGRFSLPPGYPHNKALYGKKKNWERKKQ